jgi:predicted N-acetyltransferase YhbS
MTSSPIIVRPLATTAEHETYFQLADQAFSSDPSPTNAQYWQQFVTTLPEYRPEQLRGAFCDGELAGGYILYERTLRVGAARLPTGCIGAVVTHPAYRHQGVATALMHDAIGYAFAHHYALLLLEGIPKFYDRYGYIDIFDLSIQEINRAAILAQSPVTYTIRPATLDDAASVLALYERHYGPYTGSFTRAVEQQIHRLQYRSPDNPLLLAMNPAGHIQAYLSLQRDDRAQAQEFVADTWTAALSLLQHHAQLFDGPDAPAALRYHMPLMSPLVQWMIDSLEVPDTSHWKHPPEIWAVRSESYHHRNAAWMARLAHLPTLLQAMLPEWQARWQRSLAHWSGDVPLIIGEEAYILHIDGNELRLVEHTGQSSTAADAIRLTPQAFTQLVFGYRLVSQAVPQEEHLLQSDVLSVLNVLFPVGNAWIPLSDWF